MVAYFILHRTLVLDQNDTDQGHTVVELLQDVQMMGWMGWYGGGAWSNSLGFITSNLVDNGSLLLEGSRSGGVLEDDSKWVLEGLRWVSELVSGSAGVVV